MKSLLIKEVSDVLCSGGIVAIPTDTLFALCVDATNEKAVQKLYKLKKRDENKALPMFLPSFNEAFKYCEFNDISTKIAKGFWPGQLSIVLKNLSNPKHKVFVNSANNTSMVRVPGDDFLLKLLKFFGKPITGTSANISGEENLFTSNEIKSVFPNIDFTVDGSIEAANNVKPSTIVSCLNDEISILREGEISKEEIYKL